MSDQREASEVVVEALLGHISNVPSQIVPELTGCILTALEAAGFSTTREQGRYERD